MWTVLELEISGVIEARLAEQGTTPAGSTLEAMDALWNEAKREGL